MKIAAEQIVNYYTDKFNKPLRFATIEELQSLPGVGPTTAEQIHILIRAANQECEQPIKITNSEDVYNVIKGKLQDCQHEKFYCVYLTRRNSVIDVKEISSGGLACTIVDPKIIFKHALLYGACSMILAHNHPSGNLKPSRADIDITKRITRSAEDLEMQVLDHIIVAPPEFGVHTPYYSLADNGLM